MCGKDFGGLNTLTLLLLVGTALGFIGLTLGRNHPDFDKLRELNNQLIDQVRQLRVDLQESARINQSNKERLSSIEQQLRESEQLIEQARSTIESGRTDITGLEETNKRLADWILKYGEKIQDIQ